MMEKLHHYDNKANINSDHYPLKTKIIINLKTTYEQMKRIIRFQKVRRRKNTRYNDMIKEIITALGPGEHNKYIHHTNQRCHNQQIHSLEICHYSIGGAGNELVQVLILGCLYVWDLGLFDCWIVGVVDYWILGLFDVFGFGVCVFVDCWILMSLSLLARAPCIGDLINM